MSCLVLDLFLIYILINLLYDIYKSIKFRIVRILKILFKNQLTSSLIIKIIFLPEYTEVEIHDYTEF